ncbi:MAG: hypothetical protein AAGG54_13620 [Pseudomonadota bacterium]
MPVLRIAVVCLVMLGGAANAGTIEFASIPEFGFDTTYSEQGFVFTPLDSLQTIGGNGEEKLHVEVFAGPFSSEYRMERIDGGHFSLTSVLLEPIGDAVPLLPGRSFEDDVEFVAFRDSVEIGRQNASSQDGLDKTILFNSAFQDVDEVVFFTFLAGNEDLFFTGADIHFELDNFVFELDETAVIPLPASALLLLSALGAGAGLSRLRRRES